MVGAVKGCWFKESIIFCLPCLKPNFHFQRGDEPILQDTSFVYSGEKKTQSFAKGTAVRCQNSTMCEEKSWEALIKVSFNMKSGYAKTSTDSLIQRYSRYQTICSWKIKESSLSENPRHKPNSSPSLSQNFSDVWLLWYSFTLVWLFVPGWPQQLLPFPTAAFPASLSPGAASSTSRPLLVTLA